MSQTTQARQWTVSEIIANLEAHREDLKTLGARKLGLFGSYRQETARPDSDMDFLVVFEQPSFDTYMDTKFLLEDLFHAGWI